MIISNLLKIMDEQGLKPYPLATDLDVSRTFIDSLCFNNFERLNMSSVNKLCEFLDIPLETLISYEPIEIKVLYNLEDYIDIKELNFICKKGYFVNNELDLKKYHPKENESIFIKIPIQLTYKKKRPIYFNIICEEQEVSQNRDENPIIIFINSFEYAANNILNSLNVNIKQFILDTFTIFFYCLISNILHKEKLNIFIDIKALEGESVPYSEREINMSLRIDELLSENLTLRKKLGIEGSQMK